MAARDTGLVKRVDGIAGGGAALMQGVIRVGVVCGLEVTSEGLSGDYKRNAVST